MHAVRQIKKHVGSLKVSATPCQQADRWASTLCWKCSSCLPGRLRLDVPSVHHVLLKLADLKCMSSRSGLGARTPKSSRKHAPQYKTALDVATCSTSALSQRHSQSPHSTCAHAPRNPIPPGCAGWRLPPGGVWSTITHTCIRQHVCGWCSSEWDHCQD